MTDHPENAHPQSTTLDPTMAALLKELAHQRGLVAYWYAQAMSEGTRADEALKRLGDVLKAGQSSQVQSERGEGE